MHDVLGTYQRLDRLYRLYIASAFPLRSRQLANERDALLARPGVLSQPPLIETVPVYESSGLDLTAASAQLGLDYAGLSSLAGQLFPAGRQLYRHQWEALREVVLNGSDLVVTTGTGSGKTESFLLPLFAQLVRESATWPAPGPPPADHRWWEGEESAERTSQWGHVTRPKALRAIILYPLNALVEDQLRRLRIALDDDRVHGWLNRERQPGNRITFGRYTGQTPVSGVETPAKWRRLRQELRDEDRQRGNIQRALAQNTARYEDVQYHFPRLDGGEMWSRWDMQESPPDILITNYSMLNIMLMRRIEAEMFERTRAWLAEPGHPERQFSLIVDELHAYRGTPGTEVAYVIRLLLSRLGLASDSDKLRILTTTASLDDDPKGRKFLREFFGRDHFAFISGQEMPAQAGARTRLMPYRTAFEAFAQAIQERPEDGPPEIAASRAAMATLGLQLTGRPKSPAEREESYLGAALTQVRAPDAIRDAASARLGSVRPAQAPHLDELIFPGAPVPAERPTSDAMRGLLLALGMSRLDQTGRSPQPVRGHLFFHNVQNLWACCNPACTEADVDRNARQQEPAAVRPTVGALYATHRMTCGRDCGSRVLDLIVCEVCGDVFLGGYKAQFARAGTARVVVLTADQPDLENMPDRVSLSQRHGQYAVFWPLPHAAPAWSDGPLDEEWELDRVKRRWEKAKLNRATGVLVQDASPPDPDEVPGWLYRVVGPKADQQSSMPEKCPRCDADYRRRRMFKSPLRNHRTGFQKATQVLASGSFREMAPATDGQTDEARKLVIFSDSRQDAAKLAAGMERDHFRDILRLALVRVFRRYWDDFEAYLRVWFSRMPTQMPTLLALNPALHAQVAPASSSNDLDGERRFREANPPELHAEAVTWFVGAPPSNQNWNDEWLRLVQSYPGRIPLRSMRDKIRETLLDLGLCFGGPTFKAKWYRAGGGQGPAWRPWYTCYDWSTGRPTPLVNPADQQRSHLDRLSALLMGELMYVLFPHMARTLEGLGQGWVGYQPAGNVGPQLISATDAVIRQLGVRRMHQYADHFRSGTEDRFRPFTVQYLNERGMDPVLARQQLVESGVGMSSSSGMVLAPDNLMLIPPPAAAEDGSRAGFRCPRCNAFYLHDVGNCIECVIPNLPPQRVQPSATTSSFDYYTDLTERPDAAYFRMNCEELTGQTDRQQRSRRQRWFQDIFIEDEISSVEGVDLLSVTTTMEAGVDIGALNAVMMANMPPRRFNYQQRVGRAGRRASGVSFAVTFCRGRSHDDFYFQRPESMTGDRPPPPYVDMRSEPILRRVLTKEVLRRAFTSPAFIARFGDLGAAGGESVHGEFGSATNWRDYEPAIVGWLRDPANESTILQVVERLSVETHWAGATQATFGVRMLDYLRSDLVERIEEVVVDPSYTQEALSERLANAGLLPMFGFPTRVRLLYTRWPWQGYPWPPETGTIDRDLDVAISQFAPNSQTVKDKAVHTAVGVVDLRPAGRTVRSQDGFFPPLPQPNQELVLGLCGNCQAVVPQPQVGAPGIGSRQPAETDVPRATCPVCEAPDTLRILDAREPKGFFTDQEPEDFDGQFEWQPRSTLPSLGINAPADPPVLVGNTYVVSTNTSVWSVNDNGGAGGFPFQGASLSGKPQPGAFAVVPEDPNPSGRVTVSGQKWRVALLARRMTDVLLVNVDTWPSGIFADPTTVEGRAAWYSLAFWLRLAAGAELDVDALELQAGFRSRSGGARAIGETFLSDQLENGAGYCRELADPSRFQRLLDQGDPSSPNLSIATIAAKWSETTSATALQRPHTLECDTSCNRCLRDFQNLPYHGLLDWRLALDMARLLTSSMAILDLDSAWGATENPWHGLSEGPRAPIPASLQRLGYTGPSQFGALRGYVKQQPSGKVLIERHPLWQDDNPAWRTAEAEAAARYRGFRIVPMNPFRLLRRPADYV